MILKVTCAIIEKEERVLITQRSEKMAEPLLWEFPGGKVETGETEQECLVREIKEELNIIVQPLQRLTPVLHHTPSRTIELIPYICALESGALRLLEHRASEWIAPADLLQYNWCLPDVPIVKEYLRLKHSA